MSWRGPFPRHCACRQMASSEGISQRWRAVGNTLFDLTGPRFEPQTSCSRDERVTARPTAAQKYGSTTTDREQRRLAEKCGSKYIFAIPRAILPKPSLCDEITATKSVTKTCNEIIASRSVFRSHLTWLAKIYI